MFIKVLTTAAITLLISVSVLADGHNNSDIRETKSGDPMVSLHPTANQAAAAAYYKAVEQNVFNGAIPLKPALLTAIAASVRLNVFIVYLPTLLWLKPQVLQKRR